MVYCSRCGKNVVAELWDLTGKTISCFCSECGRFIKNVAKKVEVMGLLYIQEDERGEVKEVIAKINNDTSEKEVADKQKNSATLVVDVKSLPVSIIKRRNLQ